MKLDADIAARRAQGLLLQVIALALLDDDVQWVMSKHFEAFCRLLGFNEWMIFNARQKYLRGQLKAADLGQIGLDRLRFTGKNVSPRDGWAQAWGGAEAKALTSGRAR